MSMRRPSVVLAGMLVLASTLSMTGTAAGAPAPATATLAKPAASLPAVSQPAVGVGARVSGQPPKNYVLPAGARFTFPNRTKSEKLAIRLGVLEYLLESGKAKRVEAAAGQLDHSQIITKTDSVHIAEVSP